MVVIAVAFVLLLTGHWLFWVIGGWVALVLIGSVVYGMMTLPGNGRSGITPDP
jgi:uncharacterized membrane protein SpoIIM required for sporulation